MINFPSILKVTKVIMCMCCIAFVSCKPKSGKETTKENPGQQSRRNRDTAAKPTTAVARKAPIINIADSMSPKMIVLYIKDTAISSDRISAKLAQAFAFSIPEQMRKYHLKLMGAPIAWYKSQKTPFYFEAGLPVDKIPAKLPKGFYSRNIGGDSAVVAHFFGPYESTPIAYEALNDFMKSNHKKHAEAPYEVYVGDPYDKNGKKIDPYRVQTDIFFPYK